MIDGLLFDVLSFVASIVNYPVGRVLVSVYLIIKANAFPKLKTQR